MYWQARVVSSSKHIEFEIHGVFSYYVHKYATLTEYYVYKRTYFSNINICSGFMSKLAWKISVTNFFLPF